MTVKLEDLTVCYGSRVAVNRVTAEFPPGAVGLLGRNGAGKSTILKTLLGLLRPTSGRVSILGLGPETDPLEIRRVVGYMPEKDCLIPGLNGYETVALAGQMTGLPQRDAARRAHETLYLVGLEEQRYRAVSGYSAGMRQKIKLATALVHDPQILFLDEPTNGLDPAGRHEMLNLVTMLAAEMGKSVLLSSHILRDVERTCESVVLLEKGEVMVAGPLQELTRSTVRLFDLDSSAEAASLEQALRRVGVLEIENSDILGSYRLTLPDNLPLSAVFSAVASCGGTVRRLVEHRRSLEEVFLGAVGESSVEVQ